MNRRDFLRQAASTTAMGVLASYAAADAISAPAHTPTLHAELTVDTSQRLATIPPDFTGLSYESAQLANPAFFSAQNTALIALFDELGAQGVLRIGGGTSNFTHFTTEDKNLPALFDVAGPDTSKNVERDIPITPRSLRNLRAFLDATGWHCLYGLNLGRGSVADAVEEAAHVQSILGPKLIAFQLGNEPDAWRNRYRPASFTYADYWKEWWTAYTAIHARIPQAVFAGPDTSHRMEYVTGFAQDVKKSAAQVVLLTSHYYAMGPAGAKGVTLDRLLAGDPKLEKDLRVAVAAARSAGISYRMSEGNSCWNGGQPGVSDTLASALWGADMMMECAANGCVGVNLHGGGFGVYTPIAGSVSKGFERRPIFYGMKLLRELAGATVLASRLACSEPRVRAYIAERNGSRFIITINPCAQPVQIKLPLRSVRRQTILSGPSIDAKDGVSLTQQHAHLHHGTILLPLYQAALFEGNA